MTSSLLIDMVIVDSREKRWEHVKQYFDENNIEYRVEKLDVGDYFNTDQPGIVVDRKRNLDECAQNLYSADSSRFWRELRRAHEQGIKLIFLVEHGGNVHTFEDVLTWNSRYSSKITGRKVANEMFKAHVAYKVDWLFCDKRHTPQRITEILKYDKG